VLAIIIIPEKKYYADIPSAKSPCKHCPIRNLTKAQESTEKVYL